MVYPVVCPCNLYRDPDPTLALHRDLDPYQVGGLNSGKVGFLIRNDIQDLYEDAKLTLYLNRDLDPVQTFYKDLDPCQAETVVGTLI